MNEGRGHEVIWEMNISKRGDNSQTLYVLICAFVFLSMIENEGGNCRK